MYQVGTCLDSPGLSAKRAQVVVNETLLPKPLVSLAFFRLAMAYHIRPHNLKYFKYLT